MQRNSVLKTLTFSIFNFIFLTFLNAALCDLSEAKMISLPAPAKKSGVSVEEALQKRRSIRNYSNKKLPIEKISQLLWAAQGITDSRRKLRTSPSPGALYPMEIYAVTTDYVARYNPFEHALYELKSGDRRGQLASAALGQSFIKEAGVTFVICAVYERVTQKYGQRGVMYTDMEAGHIAQNIHLQAVSLGLGSVSVGAFHEEAVAKVIDAPKEHRPIYLIPAGYLK